MCVLSVYSYSIYLYTLNIFRLFSWFAPTLTIQYNILLYDSSRPPYPTLVYTFRWWLFSQFFFLFPTFFHLHPRVIAWKYSLKWGWFFVVFFFQIIFLLSSSSSRRFFVLFSVRDENTVVPYRYGFSENIYMRI